MLRYMTACDWIRASLLFESWRRIETGSERAAVLAELGKGALKPQELQFAQAAARCEAAGFTDLLERLSNGIASGRYSPLRTCAEFGPHN